MVLRPLILAGALLAGGCNKETSSAAGDASTTARAAAPTDASPPLPPDAAPAPALFDKLVRELGGDGPVAVIAAKPGLVAVSLDGKRQATLVQHKAIRWVLVDDRARVVWFQQVVKGKSQLAFLDLTQPAPAPELAVTGLPEDELLGVGYRDKPGDDHPQVVGPAAAEYDGIFQLILDPKQPTTFFQHGQFDEIFEEQGAAHEKAIGKAKLVQAAVPRLVELFQRGDGRPVVLETPLAKDLRVDAVKADRCESDDLCGSTEPMPGTALVRVLIEHGCGDACHTRWQLYDPKTKEFFDYATRKRSKQPIDGDDTGNVSDGFVARDGKGFIVGGTPYRIDGGRILEGTGRGGGWLGGQYHVGL